MKATLLFVVSISALPVFAEEMLDTNSDARGAASISATATIVTKRTYPGGLDEEDLTVQNKIPDASLKTDSRSVQRGVFKNLYNQEMRDERTENVEE